jgi:hypothetical protein
MARNKSLEATIADAEQILRVWEANPSFTLGEVTAASFRTMIEDMKLARAGNEELKRKLTQSVNDVDSKAVTVGKVTSRALSGIRAVFGPDSSQYEEAGGTRTSDRKTPKGGGGSKKSS